MNEDQESHQNQDCKNRLIGNDDVVCVQPLATGRSGSPVGSGFGSDCEQESLCPGWWFRLGSGSCRDVLWKLCFISCCLPLCYWCYLSRTMRRSLPDHDLRSRVQNDDKGSNLLNTSSDAMSKMLMNQLSDVTLKQNNITINVIVLRSESGSVLLNALNIMERWRSKSMRLASQLAIVHETPGEAEEVKNVPLRKKGTLSTANQRRSKQKLSSTNRWLRIKTLTRFSGTRGHGDAGDNHVASRCKSTYLKVPSKGVGDAIDGQRSATDAFNIPDDEELDAVPLRKNAKSSAGQRKSKEKVASSSRWQRIKTFSKASMMFSKLEQNKKSTDDTENSPIRASSSSLYYSFDSDSSEEELEVEKAVEVTDLGQR